MVGRTIGNYQVVSLLGEGGMGKVYLALHPAIGRQSAIKVLHPNLAKDPQAVSRFLAEARASNSVRHPNIVEIFDSGTLDDGAPYIIMEHLEGETLAARIARGMPLGDALDFAAQAASALSAAHTAEVVHRDLKPENLFLIRDARVGRREQVKVLDFGVAKLQRRLEEPAHRTRSGALVGTPRYMSPEQCLGEGEVDARSDVYSLGCILYEMICGRPPFVTDGVGALINMHINRPPDPPRQLNPTISASLEAAMLRSLAKDPKDRTPSMEAFLQDLWAAQVSLGESLHNILPRDTEGVSNAPTPTPLSAMATLMDSANPATTLRTTPPPVDTTPVGGLATPVMSPIVPKRSWRKWIFLVVGVLELAMALVLFIALRPTGDGLRNDGEMRPAGAPRPAVIEQPGSNTAAAAGRTPRVEIDSDPSGATVTIGTKVIGTTPLLWTSTIDGGLVELAFVLEGYRREIIYAVPAAGLHLKPRLRRLPIRRPATVTTTDAGAPAAPPTRFDDIKSER